MSCNQALVFHDGELAVLYEFDFTARHEIETGGETLTGTPTIEVFQDGAASLKLSVSSVVINSDGDKVQFRLSDAGASDGEKFVVRCTATLSGGATLVEYGDLTVISEL